MWLLATFAFTFFAMYLVRQLKAAKQEKSGGCKGDDDNPAGSK